MCCGCPGPQGAAQSTDTGPAREPAVCSLPAAEKQTSHTQNREHRSGEGCSRHTVWNTDHMGLFGGFGHCITSLAVISEERITLLFIWTEIHWCLSNVSSLKCYTVSLSSVFWVCMCHNRLLFLLCCTYCYSIWCYCKRKSPKLWVDDGKRGHSLQQWLFGVTASFLYCSNKTIYWIRSSTVLLRNLSLESLDLGARVG